LAVSSCHFPLLVTPLPLVLLMPVSPDKRLESSGARLVGTMFAT
jgi:hypothetical protein